MERKIHDQTNLHSLLFTDNKKRSRIYDKETYRGARNMGFKDKCRKNEVYLLQV